MYPCFSGVFFLPVSPININNLHAMDGQKRLVMPDVCCNNLLETVGHFASFLDKMCSVNPLLFSNLDANTIYCRPAVSSPDRVLRKRPGHPCAADARCDMCPKELPEPCTEAFPHRRDSWTGCFSSFPLCSHPCRQCAQS